ncbi:PaaI family thioesterase [Sulfurimonas sp. MAG313]|nr:PaaI family thioesterase [Sulfurimonas sp. MAG313]MDF1879799.1 PaaI family thioesterase [Sulfurimonas sp. MAG313]
MADKTNEEILEDDVDLSEDVTLRTHDLVNSRYSGELDELQVGYAKVTLQTTDDMRADSFGLVHGGFIFSAGDFAAMAAVNEPYVVLSASTCDFLSPVRVGDEVVFEAKVRHKDGRKREVNVIGSVLEIKIFEAVFKTVVLEKHVLKLDLMHASKPRN